MWMKTRGDRCEKRSQLHIVSIAKRMPTFFSFFFLSLSSAFRRLPNSNNSLSLSLSHRPNTHRLPRLAWTPSRTTMRRRRVETVMIASTRSRTRRVSESSLKSAARDNLKTHKTRKKNNRAPTQPLSLLPLSPKPFPGKRLPLNP